MLMAVCLSVCVCLSGYTVGPLWANSFVQSAGVVCLSVGRSVGRSVGLSVT